MEGWHQRDPERVRQSLAQLALDLGRTLGAGWSLDLSDAFVLTVRDNNRSRTLQLSPLVDLEAWPDHAWSEVYRDHTLQDDADELMRDTIGETLAQWGISWPQCPTHSTILGACSGVSVCGNPPGDARGHDVAPVGRLTVAAGSADEAIAGQDRQ